MRGSSLGTECSKMPLIAATALQVFPQHFPFFFSLWAWGEVQLASHMLGIHALLVLPPGCGCSGPFVLTLPLFMAGISPAAWKMETQAPTHLFPPKSVSEERTLLIVAPMTNGLLVSTAEGHHSGEENKLIHARSCEALWLFVNWVKGKTYRKQGNVCCRHSSGWWWPILSKMNTVFTLFWAFFLHALFSHYELISIYARHWKYYLTRKILDMNLWACLR